MKQFLIANKRLSHLPKRRKTKPNLTWFNSTVAFALWILSSSFSAAIEHETTKTIGPVTVKVSLTPKQPVIGDTLNLEIEVVAQKDVEVLMPEFGEALLNLQIVDFSPREKLGDSGESIFTQKYKLRSPTSGKHFVPPVLIEFIDRRPGEKEAPDDQDAYELLTDRINFSVESVIVKSATTELRPPILTKIDRKLHDDTKSAPIWFYVVVGVATVLFGGLTIILYSIYQKRARLKSAYEIAKRQLDHLVGQQLPDKENVGRFYVSLTQIIRKYLENRFDLKAPDLTTEEFLETVADSAELTAEHKKLLQDFLRHADLVKFAGVQPTESDINESISKASTFLEETSENSPWLVDPDENSHTRTSDPLGASDIQDRPSPSSTFAESSRGFAKESDSEVQHG